MGVGICRDCSFATSRCPLEGLVGPSSIEAIDTPSRWQICWADEETVVHSVAKYGDFANVLVRSAKQRFASPKLAAVLLRDYEMARLVPTAISIGVPTIEGSGETCAVIFKDVGARPISFAAPNSHKELENFLDL